MAYGEYIVSILSVIVYSLPPYILELMRNRNEIKFFDNQQTVTNIIINFYVA